MDRKLLLSLNCNGDLIAFALVLQIWLLNSLYLDKICRPDRGRGDPGHFTVGDTVIKMKLQFHKILTLS